MAKLVVTYEDGGMHCELEFQGKTYTMTWKETNWGFISDKPSFDLQVEKEFPHMDEDALVLLADICNEATNLEATHLLDELEWYE